MTKMNEMTNMSKQTEAMKLALDKVQEFKSRWCKVPPFADRVNKATREAITLAQVPIFELEHVLQKALAEQPAPVPEPHKQQEPVATLWQHGETGRTRITMPEDITDCDARWFKAADLYTSPPAQRTWVGLTDEERIMCRSYDPEEAVTKTEAKLKEKNT